MSNEEKDSVKIVVADDKKEKNPKKKGGKEENKGPSEEDLQLQADVELLVTRIGDSNPQLASTAIDTLTTMLRTHTGSVASIPKPLKFVRRLFPQLEVVAKNMTYEDNKKRLHDLMSFIAMTIDSKNLVESSLKHKLQGNVKDLALWGHEYLRFLAGEVAAEWQARVAAGTSTQELRSIVDDIVSFMVHHQDESAALDLLMEVQDVASIQQHVDENNVHRIAAYLFAVSSYLTSPANRDVLLVAYQLYVSRNAFPHALRIALALRDKTLIQELFEKCPSPAIKVQMAYVCGRYRAFLNFEDNEQLADANGNRKISELFRFAGKELDSLAPKSPEEIFKTQMDARPGTAVSHMHNLASMMVSGMVNCGFGKDNVLSQEGTTCFYETKDHRMMSATAALGLIHLWDEGDGLPAVDKYTYAEENYIKAGAYLATGLTLCGVHSAFDAGYGLLFEHVTNANREVRIGAILGLGYAYAGTEKSEIKELLLPIIADSDQPFEVQCFAAYACALVFPATGDEDLVETCLSCLMEKEDKQLLEPCCRMLILAIGSLFLGRYDKAEALFDATQALSSAIRQYVEVVVRSCAYAGTGNVVEIQRMFHLIAENDEAEESDATKPQQGNTEQQPATGENEEQAATTAAATTGAGEAEGEAGAAAAAAAEKPTVLNHKAAAVLGIAMIALGEELGTEMAKRSLIHILLADTVSNKDHSHSGRRAVPLAYSLLGLSSANMPIVETLNRLSHDGDAPTALNAILGMGLTGAGTYNARVSGMLRQLALYYHREKDGNILFMVRLAQGLVALGKGHVTLSPLQQDNAVLSPVALVGLLGLYHCALDLQNTVLDRYHFMLYSIAPAINPRAIIALDATNYNPISTGVTIRIGQPVDTVAVAGKPKSITGFQTHNAPVLLSTDDRAEIAPGKYRALSAVVEGVILVEEKVMTEA